MATIEVTAFSLDDDRFVLSPVAVKSLLEQLNTKNLNVIRNYWTDDKQIIGYVIKGSAKIEGNNVTCQVEVDDDHINRRIESIWSPSEANIITFTG
jgi:hypothetical protein